MSRIQQIQFVNKDTNTPIVSVKGDLVKLLLEHSELIQTLLELSNTPNSPILTVPVGLGPERETLLSYILSQKPIGRLRANGTKHFYQVGSQEEKNIERKIRKIVSNSNRLKAAEDERQQTILETLRYLLIPDDIALSLLKFDPVPKPLKFPQKHTPNSPPRIPEGLELQFVDLYKNTPIVKITGDDAVFLFENSELIQTLAEVSNRPNSKVLEVPIGLSPERQRILFKVLKRVPMGKLGYNQTMHFYSLGPENEKNFAKEVDQISGIYNKIEALDIERQNTIIETLRYLGIPDDKILRMLEFDEPGFNPEVSEEDQIEEMLNQHKKWLYVTGQQVKLTPDELAYARSFFDELNQNYKKKMQKYNRRGWNSFNMNKLNEIYQEHMNVMNPIEYQPVATGYRTKHMPVREFERWLRSVYFKKAPLDFQSNNLDLNLLYNQTRRANRNRVSKPRVIYYSNANTRKANKNPNNVIGNGNAW